MPLPFILGAAAVAAGAFGVKKGLDAREDMEEAQDLLECAKEMSAEAENSIEKSRKGTAMTIENLGKTKIKILSTSMKKFVEEFSKIKNIDFQNSVGLEELKDFTPDSCDFSNLQQASFKAADLASGGLGGVAAGSLMAAGTYGAVGSAAFGAAASTGTAIAGLSGAAATNATLAWLGGGSLAAGGFGMAGGMMVLGGLVAGPALAVGGVFMASKAKEALYEAEEYYDKARAFKEQAKNICSNLSAIDERAKQIDFVLKKLDIYFKQSVAGLSAVTSNGLNWKTYTNEEKQIVGASAQIAKTIKIILDTSLLNEKGNLQKGKVTAAVKLGEESLKKLSSDKSVNEEVYIQRVAGIVAAIADNAKNSRKENVAELSTSEEKVDKFLNKWNV